MPVIQSHDITLYGDSGTYDIVLRPLADDHLPLLYRWMSDPEVTYYTESAVGLRYDEDTVRRKYGGMSRGAMCFLVEADGMPVGECWLQPMNRADVRAMYPEAWTSGESTCASAKRNIGTRASARRSSAC